MNIGIINGPNLNLLGRRETGIYGDMGFDEYLTHLKEQFKNIRLDYYQSNIEGEIIDKIQKWGGDHEGILLNAGGYTHTSVAIADAVASIKIPVIEVHISNIFSREDYRHVSIVGSKCKGSVSGFGLRSYELALRYFSENT